MKKIFTYFFYLSILCNCGWGAHLLQEASHQREYFTQEQVNYLLDRLARRDLCAHTLKGETRKAKKLGIRAEHFSSGSINDVLRQHSTPSSLESYVMQLIMVQKGEGVVVDRQKVVQLPLSGLLGYAAHASKEETLSILEEKWKNEPLSSVPLGYFLVMYASAQCDEYHAHSTGFVAWYEKAKPEEQKLFPAKSVARIYAYAALDATQRGCTVKEVQGLYDRGLSIDQESYIIYKNLETYYDTLAANAAENDGIQEKYLRNRKFYAEKAAQCEGHSGKIIISGRRVMCCDGVMREIPYTDNELDELYSRLWSLEGEESERAWFALARANLKLDGLEKKAVENKKERALYLQYFASILRHGEPTEKAVIFPRLTASIPQWSYQNDDYWELIGQLLIDIENVSTRTREQANFYKAVFDWCIDQVRQFKEWNTIKQQMLSKCLLEIDLEGPMEVWGSLCVSEGLILTCRRVFALWQPEENVFVRFNPYSAAIFSKKTLAPQDLKKLKDLGFYEGHPLYDEIKLRYSVQLRHQAEGKKKDESLCQDIAKPQVIMPGSCKRKVHRSGPAHAPGSDVVKGAVAPQPLPLREHLAPAQQIRDAERQAKEANYMLPDDVELFLGENLSTHAGSGIIQVLYQKKDSETVALSTWRPHQAHAGKQAQYTAEQVKAILWQLYMIQKPACQGASSIQDKS